MADLSLTLTGTEFRWAATYTNLYYPGLRLPDLETAALALQSAIETDRTAQRCLPTAVKSLSPDQWVLVLPAIQARPTIESRKGIASVSLATGRDPVFVAYTPK